MPKIDLDVIEALVKNGKLKPETLTTVQKYCSGGKVKKMASGGLVDGNIESLTGNLNVAQMDPAEVAKLGASYQSPEEMLRSKEVDDLVGRGYEAPATEETTQGPVPPIDGTVSMVSNDRQQAVPEGSIPVMPGYDSSLDSEIAKSAVAIGSGQQGISKDINAIANTLRDQAAADERIKAARQIEMDKIQAKLDGAINEYSSAKVDPNRFFADKSTGQKIAMSIGLLFAGINGSQAGMQMLDSAINRDIEAQKADIAVKQGKVQGYRGIYSDMLSRFHNEDMATAATRTALLNVAELNLKSKLANIEGQKAYNDGLVRLQELGVRKAQAMQQFRNAMIVSSQFQDADAMTKKVMSIPNDSTRNKALEEMASVNAAKQSLKTVNDIYNNAPGVMGYVPMTSAAALTEINQSKLFTVAKAIVGEKMTDSDVKYLVDPWIPKPKDPQWVLDKKKSEFNKWINSKVAEQTPILTGLGLVKPQKTITEGKAK